MNYLKLVMLNYGIYKVDNLVLNTLIHLIKNCETSGVTSDYIKKIPLDLWFNDFWDKLGNKIDYITINIHNDIMLNNDDEIYHLKSNVSCYDTLDKYEEYIDGLNGYLCIYSINKLINVETMKVYYEVRDCIISNPKIQRDFKIEKINT